MNNYNYFIKKHDLEVSKVTKKGNITIITTPLGQFVFKDANIEIYNYLLSRGFNYFPKIIDYNNNTIMFEYIENIDYDLEQKGQDFIKILSLLHAKTSYYKQCDVDEYKILFEDIYNRLVDINNYYNNLINVIESKVYMSPAEYLVARNITNIFLLINYCFDELKKWFELVKNNTKKRVVTLYNNTDINSLLKSTDNIYLTDFSKSTIDLPIYDLYSFYKKYGFKYDYNILIKKYLKILNLSEDELNLLYILISIPDKIIISNSVKSMYIIKSQIRNIFSVINLLNSKKEEDTSTHQEEDNK